MLLTSVSSNSLLLSTFSEPGPLFWVSAPKAPPWTPRSIPEESKLKYKKRNLKSSGWEGRVRKILKTWQFILQDPWCFTTQHPLSYSVLLKQTVAGAHRAWAVPWNWCRRFTLNCVRRSWRQSRKPWDRKEKEHWYLESQVERVPEG